MENPRLTKSSVELENDIFPFLLLLISKREKIFVTRNFYFRTDFDFFCCFGAQTNQKFCFFESMLFLLFKAPVPDPEWKRTGCIASSCTLFQQRSLFPCHSNRQAKCINFSTSLEFSDRFQQTESTIHAA